MPIKTKMWCFVLMSTIFTSAIGEPLSEKAHQSKAIQSIKKAAEWIIKDGIKTFIESGEPAIHRKLLDEYGVQLWVAPWIETERYLAQFRIKARGIHYDIHALHREKVKNHYYEFWMTKVAATEWSGEHNRAEFHITRTPDKGGQREILKRSDQFIESFNAEGKNIQLPLNSKELRYDMQAWRFPDNFKGSELKKQKILMDSEGELHEQN